MRADSPDFFDSGGQCPKAWSQSIGRPQPRRRGEEGVLDLTYFPNSPALSTAHPEQWEGEEAMLEQAVKGTAESAPGILKWARFLPSFVHKLIATRMRADGIAFQTPVRPLSAILAEHECGGGGSFEDRL